MGNHCQDYSSIPDTVLTEQFETRTVLYVCVAVGMHAAVTITIVCKLAFFRLNLQTVCLPSLTHYQ